MKRDKDCALPASATGRSRPAAAKQRIIPYRGSAPLQPTGSQV